MRIAVRVKPNSRREGVESLPDGSLQVQVNAPPSEGRANEAMIRLLAEYYRVPKSDVTITSGAGSRRKVVEVAEG